MTTKPKPSEPFTPVRLAHLSMIQGVILRLSGFSASAKNFCITILGVVIGISFQHHLYLLIAAAVLVIFVFATLDTYYLAQERRFREFYESVAVRPLSDAHQLSMAPSKLTLRKFMSSLFSFSTGGFYALLLIVAAALLFIAYDRSDETRLGNSRSTVGASERRAGVANVVSSASAEGRVVNRDADSDSAKLAVAGGNANPEKRVRNAAAAAWRHVRGAVDEGGPEFFRNYTDDRSSGK